MRELLTINYVQNESTKQNEAIINLQPKTYFKRERGKQSKLERCKNDGDWEPKKK